MEKVTRVSLKIAASPGQYGPMWFSEASARDPVFYRWHGHIDDLAQEFRDRHLTPYGERDFDLSDNLEIVRVNTLVHKSTAKTKNDAKNILITYVENALIKYETTSNIFYRRLNHMDFKYELQIKNPKGVRKKVMFRIWLGILANEKDVNTFQLKHLVEMDQFVHTLSTSKEQIVERLSTSSSATMKEQKDLTLRRLMRDIKNKKDTGTWCGLPHNLLVPRSKDFNPGKKDLGGRNFVLFAVMTDVGQDIALGSDGIEHLLCGHKEIKTKLDSKPFGFPFDRKLGFKIRKDHKFLAFSIVKILHRTENHKQENLGEKIDRIQSSRISSSSSSSSSSSAVIDMNFSLEMTGNNQVNDKKDNFADFSIEITANNEKQKRIDCGDKPTNSRDTLECVDGSLARKWAGCAAKGILRFRCPYPNIPCEGMRIVRGKKTKEFMCDTTCERYGGKRKSCNGDMKCISKPRTDNAKLLCDDGKTASTWDGCYKRGSFRIQCGKSYYPCNGLKNEKEFLCYRDCSKYGGYRVCQNQSVEKKSDNDFWDFKIEMIAS